MTSELDVTGPENGVVTLTLNRPDKKNALSIALRDQISETLDRFAGDEAVKVVVLTGAGDMFCAGFDVVEFRSDDSAVQQALWPSSDRFHHTLLRFPLPTVAAVNGPALGGGFDLATLCDLRLAASTASFAHPEQRFADVVYGPLHDLVGGALARDLCLTGRRIGATEALRAGLVSAVVEPAELAGSVTGMCAQITRAPRENLARTKAKTLARSSTRPGAPTLDL